MNDTLASKVEAYDSEGQGETLALLCQAISQDQNDLQGAFSSLSARWTKEIGILSTVTK